MEERSVTDRREETVKGMTEKACAGIYSSCAPVGYRNADGPSGKRVIVSDPDAAPMIAHQTTSFRVRCADLLASAYLHMARGGLSVLEAFHGRHARQAVPDRDQPFRGPLGGERGQFLLAGKGFEGGSNRSGGFLAGRKCAYVVIVVDRERLHLSSLFLTAYRDDHIHHSGPEHKQGDSAGTEQITRAEVSR